jgi:hypothetical protein
MKSAKPSLPQQMKSASQFMSAYEKQENATHKQEMQRIFWYKRSGLAR